MILACLPLNCWNADGLSSIDRKLQCTAIEYCDPVGQVSLDADFDEDLSLHDKVSVNDSVLR